MQVKKIEIRNEILAVSEKEFLKRGFKNSSMRTIATKAHTTLGNLYNYFENKDAILDAIIGDTPEQIFRIIQEHDNAASSTLKYSKEYLEEHFSDITSSELSKLFPLDLLLSNPLIILMDSCEGTKYEFYRGMILTEFQKHLAIHLNVDPDSFLAKSVTHGFVSSLLFIAKNKKNMEEAKKDLYEYIKTMTLGLPMPK